MAEQSGKGRGSKVGGLLREVPLEPLKAGAKAVLTSAGERAVGIVGDKVEDMTQRLTESAENGGAGLMAAVTGGKEMAKSGSPVKSALKAGFTGTAEKLKGALGMGGKGGKKGKSKVVNIIEHNDIGLPRRVVYDQWTRFEDFPSMTKKVLSVDQESDEKINWQAQIFLSKRSWQATIVEQVPDDRIVWTSTGAKGTVDGSVTFHELAPRMTRILLVIEYYPQGFFEKTAYMWRAQGRRVRADFKYIKRYMMTRTILAPDEVEGWRGEIRDREVVKTHEDALAEEEEAEGAPEYGAEEELEEQEGERGEAEEEGEYEDEEQEEYGDEEYGDEEEGEEEEGEEGEYEDEYGEEGEEEGEEDYAEDEDREPEQERGRRRRATATSGRGR
ncbi:Polyketide cyclase / dehydrase and lipid transport [Saccharopolyspora antimicrobica]|uniref:Polyketide cyclase / dehydrase and lipid transport n=1 Tax=Saccharopolyspora antimicrobica TaxID=455193 RepID=A0A1I5KWZ9_9PSEU|nr:SRPBCC family protein [Saccharopolyspora antimicrobica]RKT89097.1 polyketide cyclase/dehydrase/lipid transport protein [Saccharopolyspora antimicrobica]SFO89585.1 Polyketide cyclase / dehydrase and lipid transport [Saccharopolyspora antimicrobica]